MTGSEIKITFDNVSDYTGFDLLYKYDFYYLTQSEVALPYYYSTFVDVIGYKEADHLVAIVPDNCVGYDTLIYDAYFTLSEKTSGVTAGKYAHAFMDAVNKLPAEVDRFDTLLVNEAITAYNALMAHEDEKAFVDESFFTTFKNVRTAYNVDVVESKIDHLFDMDKLEYTFNKVKDAKRAYDNLSAEEKALVTNAAKLDEKIADLNELYGKTVDFNLSHSENLGVEEDVPPVDDGGEEPAKGLDAWVIVLIVAGSVLVLSGAAVFTVILIKRKKKAE